MNGAIHQSIEMNKTDAAKIMNKHSTQPSSGLLEDATKADTSRRCFLNTRLIKLHENSTHLEIGTRSDANPVGLP